MLSCWLCSTHQKHQRRCLLCHLGLSNAPDVCVSQRMHRCCMHASPVFTSGRICRLPITFTCSAFTYTCLCQKPVDSLCANDHAAQPAVLDMAHNSNMLGMYITDAVKDVFLYLCRTFASNAPLPGLLYDTLARCKSLQAKRHCTADFYCELGFIVFCTGLLARVAVALASVTQM